MSTESSDADRPSAKVLAPPDFSGERYLGRSFATFPMFLSS